ncbi:unnamed protein product [Gongylonema pulchrum]|uniref:C2 DOCK-type domain-containing protein n=1 Tax=Gongylonema pulchrum TaxID=637853 RepID=A0A183DPE2_9BILA|nr:unnamed protein product [Gongylonema pulchrum]
MFTSYYILIFFFPEPFGASCLWAGRNAAAKFLQPPIVKRRSLFALYSDLDQLPIPRNEAECLLSNASLDVGPPMDKPVVRFVVEFLNLNIKLSLVNTHVQQIEPFFVRMFLYDSRAGRRLSEEFAIDPNGNEFDAVLKAANSVASGNRNAAEKSTLEEDGINTLPQRVLADKNARKAWIVGSVKTWHFRPVFQEMLGCGTKLPNEMQLYRCDGNKLGDGDLQKILADFFRAEKSGKLTAVPSATISINIDFSPKASDLPMQISPSFMPLRPWNAASDSPAAACFEAQSFNDFVVEPHTSLFNLLYVYPLSLKYDGQKTFNKARNIVCTVRFVSTAGRGDPSLVSTSDFGQFYTKLLYNFC